MKYGLRLLHRLKLFYSHTIDLLNINGWTVIKYISPIFDLQLAQFESSIRLSDLFWGSILRTVDAVKEENFIFETDSGKWHKGLFKFDRNWLLAYWPTATISRIAVTCNVALLTLYSVKAVFRSTFIFQLLFSRHFTRITHYTYSSSLTR